MEEIEIRNESFIDVLDWILTKIILRDKNWKCSEITDLLIESSHKACSEEYLNQIKIEGHSGLPKDSYSKTMGTTHSWDQSYVRTKLSFYFKVKKMTLLCFYPKYGFVGWHSNYDVDGYNLLLNWSEEGKGFFRFQDPKSKEIITIPDKKGWTAKIGKFGGTAEDELWHCARTDCRRASVAMIFNSKEEQTLAKHLICGTI